MAKPWEKYQTGSAKPWEKYGGAVAAQPIQPVQPAAQDFSQAQVETPSDAGILSSIAGGAKKAGEFLGLEKATEPFAKLAARGVTRLEGVPEEAIEEAIPKPTTGEVVGGGLQLASLALPFGAIAKGGTALAGQVARPAIAKAIGTGTAGAAGGFAFEAGEKIQKGEAPTPGLATALGAALPLVPLTAKAITNMKPQKFAERLYESTLRPSTTLKPEARARVLKSALDENIVPTKAGLAKTQSLITKYTGKVDDLIDEGMKAGGTKGVIKTDEVLTRLDDVKSYFGDDLLGENPIGDIDKIAAKLKDKFPETMTVQQAQRVKRTLQKELKDAFGEHSTAKKEAAKQISRGIREELEKVFPEIAGLNQKSRGLIELNKELERAVGRLSNRNLFGLTSKIFASAGIAKDAPGAGLVLALSESILGNPRVKSRVAITLSKLGKGKVNQRLKSSFPKPRFPGDIAVDAMPAAKRKLADQRGSFSFKPLDKRLKGDKLLDAQDLIEELSQNQADIDKSGLVTVYHRTDKKTADIIRRKGIMKAQEDGVFFSTTPMGQAEGFGDEVVKLKIPIEKLELDDVFGNEAHVKVPLASAKSLLNVKSWIK